MPPIFLWIVFLAMCTPRAWDPMPDSPRERFEP